MRSDSTLSSNRRSRRAASRRSRRRPLVLTGGLVVGAIAVATLTGTAPLAASAAPSIGSLSSASFRLASFTAPAATTEPEVVEATSAVTAAQSSLAAAEAVQNDVTASGLDIGRPATVDTAGLEDATARLTAAQDLPATFLPSITDDVTALSGTVDERVAEVRGSLDAAIAKKAAEEAAEKARQEAEAAAKAKAEAEERAAATTDSNTGDGSPAPVAASGGGSGDNSPGGAQAAARGMLAGYGWGDDQMSCLVSLWNKESGWNYRAYNAGSGAYGIPQALPGGKMASAGGDWQTNAATQVAWGLGYISGRYGSPCGAWSHSQSTGWY